ncbi:MAG: polyphosphate polymerase domain-containing protein [Caldilineaceae bacterium]
MSNTASSHSATDRPKSGLRHEIKFLLNHSQHQRMVTLLREQLQPDPYADDEGSYLVTSLYYDTADYKAYWDKVNGYRFRRKIRLRVYGEMEVTPTTPTFIEIKQRVGVQMSKRRLALPYAEAVAFAQPTPAVTAMGADPDGPLDEQNAAAPVSEELHYLFSALYLQPACLVRYRRAAFANHEDYPDLRITFDTDLRCRTNNLTLLTAEESGYQTLLAPGWSILEIKVNQTMPYWLAQLLGEQGCTPRRISKYCASLERTETIRRRQHIEMLMR